MSDMPDWQKAVYLYHGTGAIVAGQDFPDWTDGVTVVTTPPAPPGDVPDWTKTVMVPDGLNPTPPVTAGIYAWYDAAQITGIADGSALATWPDLSGNGFDLTQATAGRRPTYRSSAPGTVGGKPAVWFYHTVRSMGCAGFPVHAAFTVFSVYMPTASLAGQNAVWWDTQVSTTALWVRHDGTFFQYFDVDATDTNTPSATVASVTAVWASGAAADISVNGAAPISATASQASQLGPSLTVGTLNDGTSVPFEGPICEMIFYNNVLGSADRAAVVSYLTARWQ